MKPRMSVARCCCPSGAPGPPVTQVLAIEYGWWIPELTASPVQAISRDVDGGQITYGTAIFAQLNPPGIQETRSGFFTFPVDIPQGATINSARIVVMGQPVLNPEPNDSWNGANPNLSNSVLPTSNVYAAAIAKCEDADQVDLLPIGVTCSQMNNKPRTTDETAYPLEFWRGDGTPTLTYSIQSGESFQALDVTTAVQEVVNRAGWNPTNNHIRIFMDADTIRGPHVAIGIDNEFAGAFGIVQWLGANRPILDLDIA